MKIAVAQTRPVNCDIEHNIASHLRMIELAAADGADLVVFPELSLTGYERELAVKLATSCDDPRFDVFQAASDEHNITIAPGAPTRGPDGVLISLLLFRPREVRGIYSKHYLHDSEEAFFAPGPPASGLIGEDNRSALAICYELSVPEHAERAHQNGADIYIASVAEPIDCIDKSLAWLSDIARRYSMTVVMSNCLGRSPGFEWAGKTSVWNKQGKLLSQLDDASEGLIVVDTETEDVVQRMVEPF